MKSTATLLEKARRYLNAESETERQGLCKDLDAYSGDLDALIPQLQPVRPAKVETGWIHKRPFRVPRLAAKYPDEMFTIYVPPNYTPSKAYGLVFFLHGGGKGQPRDSGDKVFESYGINDLLEESGRIVCCPCSPPNSQSFSAWNQAVVDEYLADVIEELESAYNLNPHNMILGGQSMGGIGTYHLAQRFADRFSSFLACAGAWDFAYWPSVKGATLWLVQGINDARLFQRRHGTDIGFARLARQRLVESGVDVVYREHSGCHSITNARPFIREWLQWSVDKRRDPFYRHVVAVTPRGSTPWIDFRRHKIPLAAAQNCIDFHELAPAPHSRWLTLHDIGAETLIYDMTEMSPCRDDSEKDWNAFELKLRRKHIPGGLAEAVIREDGVIEITPRNVTGLTIWLHPDMVDFRRVRIMIKGRVRHDGPVKPSLATLLESYARRRDWGLLYPAKLDFTADESWMERDQLKLQIAP